MVGAEPVRGEQPFADGNRAVDDGGEQRIELFAAQAKLDVDAPAVLLDQALELEIDLAGSGQLDFGVLASCPEPTECWREAGIANVEHRSFFREVGEDPVDDGLVDIAPAEEVVAVMADDAKQTLA